MSDQLTREQLHEIMRQALAEHDHDGVIAALHLLALEAPEDARWIYWASHPLPQRGRIPHAVLAAFEAAGSSR